MKFRQQRDASNPFMKLKKERVNMIVKMVNASLPIEHNKMIAIVEANTGLSMKKAREYIGIPVRTGDFKIEDGIIKRGENYGVNRGTIERENTEENRRESKSTKSGRDNGETRRKNQGTSIKII